MQDNSPIFARAGEAAQDRRFFFAYALAIFARSRGMDASGVRSWLGCDEANHVRAQLCRLPKGDSSSFKEDLTAISEFIGVPAAKLALIVREVEAAEALAEASFAVSEQGMLLAARDRHAEASDAPPDAPARLVDDGEDQTSS